MTVAEKKKEIAFDATPKPIDKQTLQPILGEPRGAVVREKKKARAKRFILGTRGARSNKGVL